MFVLTRLEETFRLRAEDLGRSRATALSSVIDQTLLDRVLPGIGLCITLYDIVKIEAGVMYPNDGGVWFKTQFRMVVFRPFVGEVLIAKIKKQTNEGLQLSLGFFEDIHIPEHFLPDPSFFDENEGVWFWSYTNEEGETNKMYMEMDDDVRLKVRHIKFNSVPSYEDVKRKRESDLHFATDEKPFATMQASSHFTLLSIVHLLGLCRDVLDWLGTYHMVEASSRGLSGRPAE